MTQEDGPPEGVEPDGTALTHLAAAKAEITVSVKRLLGDIRREVVRPLHRIVSDYAQEGIDAVDTFLDGLSGDDEQPDKKTKKAAKKDR